mgnify:CR=1 FL=1
MEVEVIHGQIIAKANHYQAVRESPVQSALSRTEKIRAYEHSSCNSARHTRVGVISSRFRLFVRVYHSSVRFDLDNSLKTLLDCCKW